LVAGAAAASAQNMPSGDAQPGVAGQERQQTQSQQDRGQMQSPAGQPGNPNGTQRSTTGQGGNTGAGQANPDAFPPNNPQSRTPD
jgi:hypothetical protein